MTLRHKFGLLALLYVITLVANFAMCSWCLLTYYRSFLERRANESFGLVEATAVSPDSSPSQSGDALNEFESPPATGLEARSSRETLILQILGLNALCGLAVGLLGLRLVGRWVIRPIAALHGAVVEIGNGRLSCRIETSAADELGELAEEVNTMAASIVTMQGQLVEHERRQVANQALRCIVHNIRSPLTGIRWLAEAIGMRNDLDPGTAQTQSRIVEIVDRLLTWLQGFRESVAAISMQIREVNAPAVVKTVIDGCAEAAASRRISLQVHHSPNVARIRIEQVQFVSALQVLLSNAIAGTPAGGTVRLSVGRSNEMPGYWQLILECCADSAEESMPDRWQQISQDDLAMAERVVRLHGGRLEWEDAPSRPCRCLVLLPG